MCSVELDGPFKLVKSETNSSRKHPKGQLSNPQKDFDLSEGSNLVLEVLFSPGKASDH